MFIFMFAAFWRNKVEYIYINQYLQLKMHIIVRFTLTPINRVLYELALALMRSVAI